jgi:hypothetical protein
MWKLIDCGSYPWFIMEKQKYFHCVYGVTGEYKKIAVKISQKSMRSLSDKFYLAYLKSWPLGTAPCRLDKDNAKFYIKLWKSKTKTKLMKEILKQLKATNNGKRTN